MRYAVLTYIFGDYERLHEVGERDPEADYILVTDREDLKSDTWRIVIDRMDGMTAMEKCYYVRFHPFRYAGTELCIRLDSSIAIRKPLSAFIKKMQEGYDRCLMIHPERNAIQDEYDVWVHRRRYPEEQACRCIDTMRRMGYDLKRKGLFQGTFEVVRNNRMNDDINEMVYRLLRYVALDGTIDRIDQTMTSFVINHLYSDRIRVLPVSQDIITDGRLMQWHMHGTSMPIKAKPSIHPVMFNAQCSIFNVR